MGVRHRLAARAEVPLKSSRSRAAAAGCGLEQARHKQELRAPQTARLPSRSGCDGIASLNSARTGLDQGVTTKPCAQPGSVHCGVTIS